jgi:hypothetical protein
MLPQFSSAWKARGQNAPSVPTRREARGAGCPLGSRPPGSQGSKVPPWLPPAWKVGVQNASLVSNRLEGEGAERSLASHPSGRLGSRMPPRCLSARRAGEQSASRPWIRLEQMVEEGFPRSRAPVREDLGTGDQPGSAAVLPPELRRGDAPARREGPRFGCAGSGGRFGATAR